MKRCVSCKEMKSSIDFYKRGDGLVSRCKACQNEYAKAWYKENKQKTKEWPCRSKERVRAINRKGHLRRKFGLGPENIPDVCETCGTKNANGRALSVDHCHRSGRIRGFLCNGCNVALGVVKDNPELLRVLARYIEAENESSEIEAVC